jgi:hypothetical protein
MNGHQIDIDALISAALAESAIVVVTVEDNVTLDAERQQLAVVTVTGKSITTPSTPLNGDNLAIKVGGTVTGTLVANSGQNIDNASSVPLGAGGGVILYYYTASSTWLIVSVYEPA